jgi:hypothetical protein
MAKSANRNQVEGKLDKVGGRALGARPWRRAVREGTAQATRALTG